MLRWHVAIVWPGLYLILAVGDREDLWHPGYSLTSSNWGPNSEGEGNEDGGSGRAFFVEVRNLEKNVILDVREPAPRTAST